MTKCTCKSVFHSWVLIYYKQIPNKYAPKQVLGHKCSWYGGIIPWSITWQRDVTWSWTEKRTLFQHIIFLKYTIMFTQSLFKSRISRCEQAETIENRVAAKTLHCRFGLMYHCDISLNIKWHSMLSRGGIILFRSYAKQLGMLPLPLNIKITAKEIRCNL